ncbi:potassium-transporting ATPase subunit C [Schleiferilactobacillus perolens]|nr:potassium-transporting ATPase subunit C [Schleiferilactobacillus perolens]
MKTWLRAGRLLLGCMVLVGLYTAVITGIGQTFFSQQANGSVTTVKGKVTGSTLIAQPETGDGDLWGRAMAVSGTGNTLQAGPTNLSPASTAYRQRTQALAKTIQARNPDARGVIPQELITTSGSGVDPDISLAAALWQAPRIAKARQLTVKQVQRIISQQATPAWTGVFGAQTVNVAQVNRALAKTNA